MSVLLRKSFRDLRRMRWQALGLALLTAIVVILAAGGARARGMLRDSRDVWYERLAFADLELRFTPTHRGLAQDALAVEGVADAEERLLAEGVLETAGARPLPALVQVLPVDGMPRLNRLHVLRGRVPHAGERAALIDRSLARSHDLGPGDVVSLRVEDDVRTVTIVGITLSPEHVLFPAHPEYTLPLRGTVAVVAVSAPVVEGIKRSNRIDSLLVTLAPGADADTVEQRLTKALPIALVDVLTRAEHPGHAFTEQIRATFDIYLPSTAVVIILVALALLALCLSRSVQRQRRALGTLMSLGHGPARIASTFLALCLLPVLVGALIGGLTHGAFARMLFRSYANTVGYAPLEDPGLGWPLLGTALTCLATALLACFVPALLLLRQRPAVLLAPGTWESAARSPGPAARALARLRRVLRVPLCCVLGVSHVMRRRGTTLAAVLGLGSVLAVVLAFLLVHATHRREIAAAVDRMGLDATVHFRDAQDEEALRTLAEASGGRAEPLISKRAILITGGAPYFRRVVCATPGAWVRGLRLAEGRRFEQADERSILIDHWIAYEQALSVGDTVDVYASRDAPEGETLTVAGILEGVSLGFAVIPLEVGRSLYGLETLMTGAHVASTLAPGPLEDALWRVPGTESVYSRARASAQVRANFEGSEIVLRFALGMAIAVALLFLAVLAALDAGDRSGDFAVLAALGWRARSVRGLCITEVFTRGLLALALAVPLAPVLAGWLLDRIAAANHYRMPLDTPLLLFLVVGGIFLLLLPLSAIPALRAARRVAPAQALRMHAAE